MSAEKVRLLEDLLARVNHNRELPALRLALGHEAAAVPSAPMASRPDISPPSTKDFVQRPAVEDVPVPFEDDLDEVTPARGTPIPGLAAPSAEEETAVFEEAPEIVLDEASQDVFIDEAEPSEQPSTLDLPTAPAGAPPAEAAAGAMSPDAMSRAQTTQVQPARTAQTEAVAAAMREPATQARPSDARPSHARTPGAGPVTPRPPQPAQLDEEVEAVPPTSPSVTKVSLELSPETPRPPPLPGGPTDVTDPPVGVATETELTTPVPPEAAPALAARASLEPAIITPQIIETAKVAELIGEIDALRSASFGGAIDASLTLGL